jgi:hypothetical protein
MQIRRNAHTEAPTSQSRGWFDGKNVLLDP